MWMWCWLAQRWKIFHIPLMNTGTMKYAYQSAGSGQAKCPSSQLWKFKTAAWWAPWARLPYKNYLDLNLQLRPLTHWWVGIFNWIGSRRKWSRIHPTRSSPRQKERHLNFQLIQQLKQLKKRWLDFGLFCSWKEGTKCWPIWQRMKLVSVLTQSCSGWPRCWWWSMQFWRSVMAELYWTWCCILWILPALNKMIWTKTPRIWRKGQGQHKGLSCSSLGMPNWWH